MDVDTFQSVIDADARAVIAPGHSVVDRAVGKRHVRPPRILQKQLGEIAACAHRFSQYVLGRRF